MSDFAYAYFNTELEKLDIPSLEGIFDKVQKLLAKKRAKINETGIDLEEVERINAIYANIPRETQIAAAHSSMRSMWEAVKNDDYYQKVLRNFRVISVALIPQIGAVDKECLVEKVTKLSPSQMLDVSHALSDFLAL